MKYEGKVTITLKDEAEIKISRPFDVSMDEKITFGESEFLFKTAINAVDKILMSEIEQVTLEMFDNLEKARSSVIEKTVDAVNVGALNSDGVTVTASTTHPKKKRGE